MQLDALKAAAAHEVDRLADRLWDLSRRIHAHPELAFQEVQAAAWLTAELDELGFEVERGTADLPTAFRAWANGRPGGPTVAIQAEYDALPELGHGCGHNVIAGGALGAAAAVKAVLDRGDLAGRVLLIGTPAEEGGGGKILLLDRGAYDGVDVALYVHPQTRNAAMGPNNAHGSLTVTFEGVPASASGGKAAEGMEHLGASALNGLITTFNAVNALRQHFQRDVLVRGIITEGGRRHESVVLKAEGWFSARGPDHRELASVLERIEACAHGAALATGTRVSVKRGPLYAERVPNDALKNAMRDNMLALGLADVRDDARASSSTDSGNVSQVIPLLAGRVAIAEPAEGVTPHSRAFAEAAGSERARDGVVAAAKVLAWTALDLLARPELLEAARAEFRARTGREPGRGSTERQGVPTAARR
jgi:amidohydrolase